MKAAELCEDIRKYCAANANEAVVKKYARFFREGYDAYGLTPEKFNEKVTAILKDKSVDMKLVIEAGNLLVKSGKYEETSFAICLLKEFSSRFDIGTFKAVEKWFQSGIVNWAHTDIFCGELLSRFFEKKVITLKNLSKWRIAKNKYQRRAVPVAMLELLKTTKNYEPMFVFIEPLMTDEEEKVQQGLGWFLREAWKNRRKETERFLMKWKNNAPRKIYQYATEKMTALAKKRFKRDESK
jgi:3-methyladenine DNA glycosylase AlkD